VVGEQSKPWYKGCIDDGYFAYAYDDFFDGVSGTIMPYPTPQNDVQINRVHTGAVCKEMGERLSIALGPESIELQPRLLSLMKQLAEQA
jgi:hypothetical protein